MILILSILISTYLACESLIDERSMYPTVGEYFQLQMTEIFSGQCNSYQCDGCTNEIQIYNATEIIIQNTLNQNIISVTSNETHFAALSDLYLIIYKKGNVSQEYQNLFELPENMSCINLIYSQPDTILLDCYQEDQLILLQFNEDNFMNVYNSSSHLPQSTQIEVYFNYSQSIFLLYAQYYQNYSILTLLSNQNNSDQIYQNLSVCQYQDFIEFHSSYQFIYLIQNHTLYQMKINQQYQFINTTNQQISSLLSFSVYQSQNERSCDNIIVITFSYFQKYLACSTYISKQLQSINNNVLNSESIKCISSNNFIIILDYQYLLILSNGQYINVLQTMFINENTQLIYNVFSDVLYLFQSNFIELQIRVPALVINSQDFTQNGPKIIITAYENNEKIRKNQSSTITIQILQEQDKNIYVQFQNKKLVNFIYYNQYQYQYQNIDNYSGQLLKVSIQQYNKTENLGQYYQTTLKQFLTINEQDCRFCSFLNIPIQNSNPQILVLATNQSLIIKSCNIIEGTCLSNQIYNSKSPIEQLQLTQNLIGQEIMIAGIRTNSYFINCVYFNLQQSYRVIYQNQVNGSGQFLSYLLNQDGLYILFSNSSINFYKNCTQNQVITIDQQSINKAFYQSENYSFIPTNITTNVQLFSSLLYINNQTNILVITLINNKVIPISRIQIKNSQIIYGINLISNRLVLSFYNNQTLSFEVWNLFNIYQPYFEKNLFEINLYNLINIYSDNLFLYVQFNSTQLYIYNPALSQHSALLTNQTLTSSLMCSIAIIYPQSFNLANVNQNYRFEQEYLQSILLINSNLYTIYPINQINFQVSKAFQTNTFYPQVNYNLSLSSYLSSQTFNQSTKILIYFFNFSNISSESLEWKYDNNNVATILPVSSQISECKLDHICLNYKDTNELCYYNQSYLINFINDQIFYLDNNSSIYKLNQILTYQNCDFKKLLDGSQNNLDLCLESTQFNNSIFAICINKTSSYLVQYDLTFASNPIQVKIINTQQNLTRIPQMQILQNGIFFTAKNYYGYYQMFAFDQNTNITHIILNNVTNLNLNQSFIAIQAQFFLKQFYIVTYIHISSIYCILLDSQFNLFYGPQQIPYNFLEVKNIQLNSIIFIEQIDNYMVALLTNNLYQYPLLIFRFNVDLNLNDITLSTTVEYLKFLPAFEDQYGKINLNVQFFNGYLVISQIYYQDNNILIQIYSLEDYKNIQDPSSSLCPILMQKQVQLPEVSLLTYQISFNMTSNLITYALFSNFPKSVNQNKKINQQILQINPKQQLQCQFEPKYLQCCSNSNSFANSNQQCTNIHIQTPKIILNLILPMIVIILLLWVLYRKTFAKTLAEKEQGNHIEL